MYQQCLRLVLGIFVGVGDRVKCSWEYIFYASILTHFMNCKRFYFPVDGTLRTPRKGQAQSSPLFGDKKMFDLLYSKLNNIDIRDFMRKENQSKAALSVKHLQPFAL